MMNDSCGINYLFDVLFHEVMETRPHARQQLHQMLSRCYARYTPSQRQALDEVFTVLFYRSFFQCFGTDHHD